MYDCCNIRMTGLYTASSWDTANGRVTTAGTMATQEWNREPWDAGWSLTSQTAKDDCVTDCAEVDSEAHADFAYQGVFDHRRLVQQPPPLLRPVEGRRDGELPLRCGAAAHLRGVELAVRLRVTAPAAR